MFIPGKLYRITNGIFANKLLGFDNHSQSMIELLPGDIIILIKRETKNLINSTSEAEHLYFLYKTQLVMLFCTKPYEKWLFGFNFKGVFE